MSIVRTAYAFSPTAISGCVLWMDAADSSTITLSSTAITQWNDKSSAGNNFVQATTANSPTVGTSANGLPTVYFASANQQLVSSQNNATTGNASRTVIQVFWCPTLSSAYYSVTGTESGANPAQAWGHAKNANSDVTYPFMYSSAGNDVYTFVYSTPNPLITYAQYDSTASSLTAYYATSGATGGTTTVGNFTTKSCTFNTTAGVWYLGRRQQAATGSVTSHLLEMIHFNKVLSTTERQQVESYLVQKWALTELLSAGHPGRTSRIYRSDYLVPNRLKPTPYYTQFSPRQIPGLVVWLDGADPAGNGVIPANGSTISTWTDKSGNGNNGTAVNTPTYALSSKGVATSSGAYFTLPNGAFPFNDSSYTYFFVFTTTTTGSVNSLFGGGVPGTTRSTVAVRLGTNGANNVIQTYWWANGINDLLVTNTYSANVISIAETWYATGSTRTITLNFTGSSTDSPAVPGARLQANTNNYLGLAYPGDGALTGFHYEFIVYNTSLSTTNRQQVESYLAQKWGLTASIPSGHSHLTQQAGAVTTVALSKLKVTGLPRITFASTGLVITHQDGRTWKATANNPGYANYAIGLNSGTSMSLNIYAGADVFNSAGGRVALLYNGDTNNAVRHAGYVMWTSTFAANNFDFGWKFVSSGSGYLIYNDYPSYSSWQVSYDSGSDRVLIVAPADGRYGLVWNVTPRVTLAYVYSSY